VHVISQGFLSDYCFFGVREQNTFDRNAQILVACGLGQNTC
jgi:hypothetical protein